MSKLKEGGSYCTQRFRQLFIQQRKKNEPGAFLPLECRWISSPDLVLGAAYETIDQIGSDKQKRYEGRGE